MYRIAHLLTLIGSLIGGWELLNTMAFAESAPQQAAGAAMALAWAVLPYCFARAVEKIGEVTTIEAFERHWRREEDKTATVVAPVQMPKFHPLTGQPLP